MVKKIIIIAMVSLMAGVVVFAQGKGKGKEMTMTHEKMGDSHMKCDCPMMGMCPMMGGINIDALKKQLKLTDDQEKQISALILEHKKEMLKYEEEMAPQPIKLKRMLLEDTVNLDEVKTLINDIARLHGEMHFASIKNTLEVEKVLTPEQRAKFKAMHHMGGGMMEKGMMNKTEKKKMAK